MTNEELSEKIDKIEKQNRILLIENGIQTLAVLLFFFAGIATIWDINKKLSKQ